jgi:hypothetical protein
MREKGRVKEHYARRAPWLCAARTRNHSVQRADRIAKNTAKQQL